MISQCRRCEPVLITEAYKIIRDHISVSQTEAHFLYNEKLIRVFIRCYYNEQNFDFFRDDLCAMNFSRKLIVRSYIYLN
jgi:hypothetical protein